MNGQQVTVKFDQPLTPIAALPSSRDLDEPGQHRLKPILIAATEF